MVTRCSGERSFLADRTNGRAIVDNVTCQVSDSHVHEWRTNCLNVSVFDIEVTDFGDISKDFADTKARKAPVKWNVQLAQLSCLTVYNFCT